MRTVCIIQARLASTRLPGKVLVDIAGKPMLAHVIERAAAVAGVDEVVVATTSAEEDREVCEAARKHGARPFAGSPADVLDRFYRAACEFQADSVVRVTADCPLLDPVVGSRVSERFTRGDLDYCSNILPPTYPDGLDVEVVSFATLERMWREADLPSDREHVTTYIRTRPARFRTASVEARVDLSALRWTVDEPDDLRFVREVFRHLAAGPGELPGFDAVLRVVREHPELAKLNASFQRNKGWERSIAADPERSDDR